MKKAIFLILTLLICLPLLACNNSDSIAPSTLTPLNTAYLYQHDGWNLYKATMLSDTTIKIENWSRQTAGKNGDPFTYNYDLCVISITDASMDFKWLDDSHTAFSVTLSDSKNLYMMNGPIEAHFAIKPSDSATSYSYQYNEWNLYKATMLSDTTIKIENWSRFTAGENGDPFTLNYDLCVISITDASMDFKWLDDSHTAFSVTLSDSKNLYMMNGPIEAHFTI